MWRWLQWGSLCASVGLHVHACTTQTRGPWQAHTCMHLWHAVVRTAGTAVRNATPVYPIYPMCHRLLKHALTRTDSSSSGNFDIITSPH